MSFDEKPENAWLSRSMGSPPSGWRRIGCAQRSCRRALRLPPCRPYGGPHGLRRKQVAQTGSATQISEVHTVTVPVSSQDRALAFYVDQLGFEKRMDVNFGEGQRWIEVAPAGAATTIALPPPGGAVTPGVDTGIRLTTLDAEADHR